MRPPFQVIDSDGHINEPEEIIATYMPPPYDAYLHAWKANADGDVYSNNTLVPKQPGMDPTMGGARARTALPVSPSPPTGSQSWTRPESRRPTSIPLPSFPTP